MLTRAVVFLAASLFSMCAIAGESEQLCAGGGYYSGAQVHFMTELVTHILQKREELGDKKCTALWDAAYEVGERVSKTGKIKPEDSAILKDVIAFRSRIYSSLAKSAGY
jgi:hypothetical protein